MNNALEALRDRERQRLRICSKVTTTVTVLCSTAIRANHPSGRPGIGSSGRSGVLHALLQSRSNERRLDLDTKSPTQRCTAIVCLSLYAWQHGVNGSERFLGHPLC